MTFDSRIHHDFSRLEIKDPKLPPTISYERTYLPPKATNDQTKCPNSQKGPCTGEKLTSPNAPMTQWPSSK